MSMLPSDRRCSRVRPGYFANNGGGNHVQERELVEPPPHTSLPAVA